MLIPAVPIDECARQAAVDQLNLADQEVEEAFERVVRLLSMLLGVPIAMFNILHHDRVLSKAVTGLKKSEGPRDISFCAHSILSGEVFMVQDARTDEAFSDNPYVIGPPYLVFYASVPVHAPNGQPVGALCAIDLRPRTLTHEMRKILLTLAAVLEDELRLRLLSTVDHLTGLFNRRQFDDVIKREWRRALRLTLPLSLVSADIDHFKLFNDHYGHLAGDRCLRKVGSVLRKECTRSGDQAFRTGGEEFAVILPGTDQEGAQIIAHRLLNAIHTLAIPNEAAPLDIVTTSIGLTTADYPMDGDLEAFLRDADETLYAAKAQGRDCVVANRFVSTEH